MSACRRRICSSSAKVAAFALATLAITPVKASVDGCGPTFALNLGTKTECENVAVLAPGNDTRVNLLLLLLDRNGRSPSPPQPIASPVLDWRSFRAAFSAPAGDIATGFATGEGSRCRSDVDGSNAFASALKAATAVGQDEKDALLVARKSLPADCAKEGGTSATVVDDAVKTARSDVGRAFATYVRGADAFYRGRFDDAIKDFAVAAGSADPWLADTGSYMVARATVNLLQVGVFDQYGSFAGSDHIDQTTATRAEASLNNYLERHPAGRYVASARGLLRRVDWLAGRNQALASLYSALLAKPASDRDIDDLSLVEEIDSKLLPTLTPDMTKDPILLAVLDLKAMRKPSGRKDAPIDPATIAAQREAFASTPALHEFIMAAAAFFVGGESAPVIKGLPDATRRRDGDRIWFSRQFLRGLALEAAGDRNSRGFWRDLYPGTPRPLERSIVELSLALHEEKHGELADVFADGSLVTNPNMRTILLEHDAGPALLRARAHDPSAPDGERRVATFTLLYKELTRGRYADFQADLAAAPADAAAPSPGAASDSVRQISLFTQGESAGEIACPALATTVSRLERKPQSIRDTLCLAEFVRLNGLDENPADSPTAAGELGSTASTFPGRAFSRLVIYRTIVDDKNAPPADRSYALFRAVKCFEPSGNNACGGPESPKAERRDWFNALKRDYPASRWARSLTYWW